GLKADWSQSSGKYPMFSPKCWMNPPYSKRQQIKWVKKAYEESQKGCTVVCLLPARPDTKLFHNYVMKAKEVRFIEGRLKFGDSKDAAPFPSMLVVFKPGKHKKPKFSTWRQK